MKIEEIENPIEKFVAFIAEREAIRMRRFVMKKPWPWTDDDILQEYRFTNIHREDDAVSQHYQNTVRNRYSTSPLILPATVIYRWFNRPSTCDAIFRNTIGKSYFEAYIHSGDLDFLNVCINQLPTPHVTGAYLIPSKEGYSKAEGVLQYIHGWMHRRWAETWEEWKKDSPLLSQMFEWLNGEGLGSFMIGQIIADLKYLEYLKGAEDWWTWATPGPGSKRGLNIVYDQPMEQSWPKGTWLPALVELSNHVTPLLKGYGIDRLHNQDLQNCLCEFSKYTKTARGIGRPRQIFRNRG